MGVVTSAIIGAAALGKGIYDTVEAKKEKKRKLAEIDSYQRQLLGESNAYENMQISTIGTDAMREESSRNIATAINFIGNAGSNAVIGATGKLVAEQNDINRDIQIELDNQVIKRNYAIAGDKVRIRDMQENRENADLAGLGNAVQVANQDANTGMSTALNGAMFAISSYKKGADNSDTNGEDKFSIDKSVTSTIGWKPGSKYGTASSFQNKTPQIGLVPNSSSASLYEYLNSLNTTTYNV